MKIFIFEDIEKLTSSYHGDGSLIIIAKDLHNAIGLAGGHAESIYDNKNYIKLSTEEIKNVISYDLVSEVEEKVFVFPNSGCC